MLRALILSLVFLSPSGFADSSEVYSFYSPITDSMTEVNRMTFLRSNDQSVEVDDYTRIYQGKYLLVSGRKFRATDFIGMNRSGSSVYRADIKVCDDLTGCLPFPFKIYEFEQPWTELRDEIRALNDAQSSESDT